MSKIDDDSNDEQGDEAGSEVEATDVNKHAQEDRLNKRQNWQQWNIC